MRLKRPKVWFDHKILPQILNDNDTFWKDLWARYQRNIKHEYNFSQVQLSITWGKCGKGRKKLSFKTKTVGHLKKKVFVSLSIDIYLFLPCISFLKIAFNISIVTVLKLQLIPLSFLLARLQIIFKFALKFVRLVTNFQTAPT